MLNFPCSSIGFLPKASQLSVVVKLQSPLPSPTPHLCCFIPMFRGLSQVNSTKIQPFTLPEAYRRPPGGLPEASLASPAPLASGAHNLANSTSKRRVESSRRSPAAPKSSQSSQRWSWDWPGARETGATRSEKIMSDIHLHIYSNA